MNYKILSVTLAIACIVLGINYYRLDKFTTSIGKRPACPESKELITLRAEKESWQEQIDELKKRNNALASENRRLKEPKVEQPVETTINEEASGRYNDLLSKRYIKK
jgi:cell division protein FtsB